MQFKKKSSPVHVVAFHLGFYIVLWTSPIGAEISAFSKSPRMLTPFACPCLAFRILDSIRDEK